MIKNYAFLVFVLLGSYALRVPQAHAGDASGMKNVVQVPAGTPETFSPLQGGCDIRWFSIAQPHMPPETIASGAQQNPTGANGRSEKYLAPPPQTEIFRHPPGQHNHTD